MLTGSPCSEERVRSSPAHLGQRRAWMQRSFPSNGNAGRRVFRSLEVYHAGRTPPPEAVSAGESGCRSGWWSCRTGRFSVGRNSPCLRSRRCELSVSSGRSVREEAGRLPHSDKVSRLWRPFGCAVVEWVAGWWLTLGREVMSVPGGRMTRTPATPRTVTSRVLAILGAFASERRELGLVEISRRTGLAVSTTHRLVGELLEGGALERSADRRYRIGPTVRDLVVSPTARAQDYGRPRRPE